MELYALLVPLLSPVLYIIYRFHASPNVLALRLFSIHLLFRISIHYVYLSINFLISISKDARTMSLLVFQCLDNKNLKYIKSE